MPGRSIVIILTNNLMLTSKVVGGESVVVVVGGCSVSRRIPSPDPPSAGAASTRPPKFSRPVQFLKTTLQNSSRNVSDCGPTGQEDTRLLKQISPLNNPHVAVTFLHESHVLSENSSRHSPSSSTTKWQNGPILSNTDVQNGDSVGSTSVGVSVGDVVSPNGVMMSVLVSPVLLVELDLEELDDELGSSHCSVPKGRTSVIANKYTRVDIVSSFLQIDSSE